MSKIGFDLAGDAEDPMVDGFMKTIHGWGQKMEGDVVGPFDHPDGVAANAPFDVAHDLGEIPGSIAVEDPGYTGAGVYATAEDREKWTAEVLILRSSDESNKNVVIRVRGATDA